MVKRRWRISRRRSSVCQVPLLSGDNLNQEGIFSEYERCLFETNISRGSYLHIQGKAGWQSQRGGARTDILAPTYVHTEFDHSR